MVRIWDGEYSHGQKKKWMGTSPTDLGDFNRNIMEYLASPAHFLFVCRASKMGNVQQLVELLIGVEFLIQQDRKTALVKFWSS